uniref:Uncharacterized protein n=5 Tax=Ralstonia solanacearum species complex TaxID=3116862 RepID=A0A0S4WWC6_RALSL|nr:conserved membrane protein of unknown function [Ralstonia solanacearum]
MYSHADIAGWASVVVLAVLVITSDLRSRRVPNWLVAVGLVLSIVLVKFGSVVALAYDWRDVWLGGAIALAGFLPLYALGWMGAGDVKFFAVAGLLAGWHGLVAIWLVSSVLAGVHALAILLLRRADASAPAGRLDADACLPGAGALGRRTGRPARHSVRRLHGNRAAEPAVVARRDAGAVAAGHVGAQHRPQTVLNESRSSGPARLEKESAMPTLQREWVSAHRGRVGLRAAARRGCRGVAAVEFAVVVPVLLLLMLGIVYYGVIFAMQQALTLAAEEGARAALRYQSTNAQRVAAAYTAVSSVLPTVLNGRVQTNQGSTPLVACQNVAGMQCLSVVLTMPLTTGNNPLLPAIPLLPVPSTLTGSAVVQLVSGS